MDDKDWGDVVSTAPPAVGSTVILHPEDEPVVGVVTEVIWSIVEEADGALPITVKVRQPAETRAAKVIQPSGSRRTHS